jgi:hypothetical protein
MEESKDGVAYGAPLNIILRSRLYLFYKLQKSSVNLTYVFDMKFQQ